MPTLFIDNLPQGLSSHELRRLFGNHGSIADAYVPRIQRSRSNGRFGFIAVQTWEQGERLIHEIDGKEVGSMLINVNWAKYPKRAGKSKRLWQPTKEVDQSTWRTKEKPSRDRVNGEPLQQDKLTRVIKVEKAVANLEWLERSLTCCSDSPRDIASLRLMIQQTFKEKIVVRDLGKFKFLLTFDSKEIKDRLKTEGKGSLEQWFSSFSDWNEVDVCQTRRIWLEIVGLPIQLWSEKNIKEIAGNWGDVVLVEEESASMESFASAKVIVDTLSVNQIADEAIIQVEDKGFRISVFEAKTEFTIFHTGPLAEGSLDPSSPKENGEIGIHLDEDLGAQSNQEHGNRPESCNNVGDEVRDREGGCGGDLNLNLNSNALSPRLMGQSRDSHIEANNTMNRWDFNREGGDEGVNAVRVEGVLEMAPLMTLDAEVERADGRLELRCMSEEAGSHISSNRTKTAQLSGIGYSTELRIINQLNNDQARMNQECGLEVEVNQNEGYPDQLESGASTPPGFGSVNDSAPPGFEGVGQMNGVLRKQGKAKRRTVDPVAGIRVTRSQMRKAKSKVTGRHSSVARKRDDMKVVKASPCDRHSIESTESMKQLAEEALKVGEMLGIKVISHRANAVKRITDSLKAKRAT